MTVVGTNVVTNTQTVVPLTWSVTKVKSRGRWLCKRRAINSLQTSCDNHSQFFVLIGGHSLRHRCGHHTFCSFREEKESTLHLFFFLKFRMPRAFNIILSLNFSRRFLPHTPPSVTDGCTNTIFGLLGCTNTIFGFLHSEGLGTPGRFSKRAGFHCLPHQASPPRGRGSAVPVLKRLPARGPLLSPAAADAPASSQLNSWSSSTLNVSSFPPA